MVNVLVFIAVPWFRKSTVTPLNLYFMLSLLFIKNFNIFSCVLDMHIFPGF